MLNEHLVTVMMIAALTWALGATLAALRGWRTCLYRPLFYALAALGVLVGVLWVAWLESPGKNSMMYLAGSLLGANPRHVAASAAGLTLGFAPAVWPWLNIGPLAGKLRPTNWLRGAVFLSVILSFLFAGLFVLEDKLRPVVASTTKGLWCQYNFVLEQYHQCRFNPIQIVVGPDGHLYATGYAGVGDNEGLVARLAADPSTGAIRETVIASNLNRPYGLAFDGTDLYVSRSGQYTRAKYGQITQVHTGSVTLLRDLDGMG